MSGEKAVMFLGFLGLLPPNISARADVPSQGLYSQALDTHKPRRYSRLLISWRKPPPEIAEKRILF
jgi:hypothetical protein